MSDLFPLIANGAEMRRGGKVLVGPVDLHLDPDGVTVVIGPNGAGKTSLLRILHGIGRLSGGQLSWRCEEAAARSRQSFVFQSPVMLRRSVRENLVYPLRIRGVSRREAIARAVDWATRVGLSETLNRQATRLSGGERQKLALARAMISEPEVLFLDEPCAALDGRATREIEEILGSIVASGTRLIMASHNMGQVRRLATEVVFILSGRVHEFSDVQKFFEGPETEEARAFLRGDIVE